MGASAVTWPKLSHYSEKPLGELYDCEQEPALPNGKPNGLWVSVADAYGWAAWCKENNWRLLALEHRYEIVLHDDANVLWLRSENLLHSFTREFSREKHHELDRVDWQLVAQRFDGILIAPYIWQSRLRLLWYYGWDCASGCLWRARAVARVTPVAGWPLAPSQGRAGGLAG